MTKRNPVLETVMKDKMLYILMTMETQCDARKFMEENFPFFMDDLIAFQYATSYDDIWDELLYGENAQEFYKDISFVAHKLDSFVLQKSVKKTDDK